MKIFLTLLVSGFVSVSWAEYIENSISTKDAVKKVLNSKCGNAGEFVSEEELDSGYDYGIYKVEFINGWADVTVSRKEWPTEPWDEYDYYVEEYACTKTKAVTNDSVPAELELYMDGFFSDECDITFDSKKVSVNKTGGTYSESNNTLFSFSKSYDVYYNNKLVGEAIVSGVGRDDEEPVSDWDFNLSCPLKKS